MNTENNVKNACIEECVLVPATDIYETSENYTLTMEMPGVSKENLEVTLENNELEISGKLDKADAEEKNGRELKYSEYRLGNYYRKFKVGNDINAESVKAELDNGILTVILNKSERVKPKRIPISVG